MPNPRFVFLLVSLAALGACSSPADPDPFRQPGSTPASNVPSNASAALPPGSEAETRSDPGGSAASPNSTGSAAAGSENVEALPLAPGENAGSPPSPPNSATPPSPAAPIGNAPLPADCYSYETGFLPLVHAPVCSGCHTASGNLPSFEPFAAAERRCASIGQRVASGEMPPRGSLSAQQRAIVASWVSLDCPETAADAALACTQPAAAPDPGAAPPPARGAGSDDDGEEDDREEEEDDDDD